MYDGMRRKYKLIAERLTVEEQRRIKVPGMGYRALGTGGSGFGGDL